MFGGGEARKYFERGLADVVSASGKNAEGRMENISERRMIRGEPRAPQKVILRPIQFFSFVANEDRKRNNQKKFIEDKECP